MEQVRQQDAYPANARGRQLRLCATPLPIFKGNISFADCMPLYLAILALCTLLELTTASIM